VLNIQQTFTETFSSKLYLTFGCPLAASQPFWKMAATATRGQLADGSTSEFVHNTLVYLCAKFGAFIKKCTIG